jgi:hypothetical protein
MMFARAVNACWWWSGGGKDRFFVVAGKRVGTCVVVATFDADEKSRSDKRRIILKETRALTAMSIPHQSFLISCIGRGKARKQQQASSRQAAAGKQQQASSSASSRCLLACKNLCNHCSKKNGKRVITVVSL